MMNLNAVSARINVTDNDIANGTQYIPGNCAIALALKRLGYESPIVGPSNCYVMVNGAEMEAVLPEEASAFVHAFDLSFLAMNPVPAPFEFELAFVPAGPYRGEVYAS